MGTPLKAVMTSPMTRRPYESRVVPLIPDLKAGPSFLASSTRMPETPSWGDQNKIVSKLINSHLSANFSPVQMTVSGCESRVASYRV